MKVAVAVVAVVLAVACAGANAQGSLYYGVEPAPSMAAAMAGAGFTDERGVPVPAAPSMEAIMAGSAPYMMQQQQPYAAPSSFVEAPVPAAAPFATEEAHEEEEVVEEAADEEAEEASEEVEEASEDGVDVRFAERKHGKIRDALKKAGKKVKKAAKKVGKVAKKAGKAAAKLAKKAGKAAAKLAKKAAKAAKKAAKKLLKKGKKTFKPKMGKHKNTARSPSAKTPKSAGKKLPPMPAPLPKKFKINCKKNPKACIEAETPAEGEEPGDHSPKAVFHKKMEVIKKALMINNRNIAQESKWIDQVKLIMKQYDLKMKKVSQHIGDERKAIKELLRQRRIILNEKKQKELELKLKMATQELAALADAESQVKQKSVALSNGKSTLSSKISVLTSNLEKLRTDKTADEQAAAKKADF